MQINTEIGKLPPMDIDLEKTILGSLLLEGEKAYNKIASIIGEKAIFYKEQNQIIYNSIVNLIDKKDAVDIGTVINELRQKNKLDEIGGPSYIITLTKKVGSSAHIETHTKYIKEKAIKRDLIRLSSIINERAFNDEDVFDIYKDAEQELSSLFDMKIGEGIDFELAIDNALYDIKGRMDGSSIFKVETNTEFDTIFDFSSDELMWIGGLPKAGKSKTIMKLISLLFNNNENIACKWFSMEDPQTKVIANFAAMETNIIIKRILGKTKDKLSDEEYDKIKNSIQKFKEYDINIAYGNYTIEKLSLEAKNFVHKRKDKFNIIIIDNFNILSNAAIFIKGNDTAKENHVASKIQQLKLDTNSNGYNTIVVVLDHLSKEAMRDGIAVAYRPSKGTLKGSGRKGEVLTQLISINKPSEFKDLAQEEYTHEYINIEGKQFKRKDIFDRLVIYEALTTRDDTSNRLLKYLADLGTMQFESLKSYVKNSKSNIELNEVIADSAKNEDFKIEDLPFVVNNNVEEVPF